MKDLVEEYLMIVNPEAKFADGLDDAIIGVAERITMNPVVAYNLDKCIEILALDMVVEESDLEEGETIEDKKMEMAMEYFDYNTIGAWVGEGTPVFIRMQF